MKTSIITTTLKKSIWLHRYNEKCLDPDYARQEFELKEGETCYVKIKTYDDGRTYFTYFSAGKDKELFKDEEKNIFSNVMMVRDGRLYLNTGMVTLADEIEFKKYLNVL